MGIAKVKHGNPSVLLQIVPVMVQTPQGKMIKMHALLDSSSQATLVLESFATQVGLDGKEVPNIGTVSFKKDTSWSKRIAFHVSSTVDSNKWLAVDEAWTIPQLNLPNRR